MNSQVTILDRNNQSILVDLISYFKLNNKIYIFYNKNEIVQDGLIKMYVSEQNNGINVDISQDEWNSLKKVMQDIITGNSSVEFMSYSNPVVFNEPKAIALNDTNINIIKTAYKNVVNVNIVEPVLNKDILTQNFGNNVEVSTNQVSEQPVEISAIPNVQNNINMESTPVNMNMEVPSIEPIGTVSEVPIIENQPVLEPVVEPHNQPVEPSLENPVNDVVQIQPIESVIETPVIENTDMGALNINSIKPGGIDSGFKVSNEPNIFDNPSMAFSITEEEINNVNDNQITEETNDVKVFNEKNNEKMIVLNNKKIKLFEELANIYREENELLKGNESNDLEKTASNLFDNNGSLNINEVLN